MAESNSLEITHWLAAVNDGREGAIDVLLQMVYKELRELAQSHLRHERAWAYLNPTALVWDIATGLLETLAFKQPVVVERLD